MTSGYVYVLQNSAYGSYVVKIGLTTRTPDIRAREIYAGSTGVPLPFDIAVAYSVGDCVRAERVVHKCLRAYRINQRREFFRISPSVAATIVLDTCNDVNTQLGLGAPTVFALRAVGYGKPGSTTDSVLANETETIESPRVVMINLGRLREMPVGTSKLTAEQLDRAHILGLVLDRVYPKTTEKWQEGFSQDVHPEIEIKIWEAIAKAFMTVDESEYLSDEARAEAFALLLSGSMTPTDEVLRDAKKLKHFTLKAARKLLKAYELRPIPLLVSNLGKST